MKNTTFKLIKYLTLLGIVTTLFSVEIASAQRNSFTVKDRNGKEVIVYQESHALVIWAGNYEHWGKLNNVENEAKDVKRALEKQGFQVTLVDNPNGNELRNKIKEFIDSYGYIRSNRLVIFFAGHGHTRQETRGYLVPVDAPDPTIDERGFLRAALPMRQIMTWAELMEAKHALFVFDSCFSGTIFKQRSQSNARDRYIQDVMNKPVRQFLTAGDADEKVPAKSVFTPLFIRAIEGEADLYKDGYVTGTELGLFMRQKLSVYTKQQTPQFGTILDPYLDQGDIVFQVPNSTILSHTQPTPNPPSNNTAPSQSSSIPTIVINSSQPPSQPSPIPTIVINSPQPQPSSSSVNLSLEQLLANKRWREANDKTWERLIREGDKNNNGILESSEVEKLQCQTLWELDDIWSQYSNGKYGFSVQIRVYSETHSAFSFKESNVNAYTLFAQKVGWYKNNRWLSANDLFNQVPSQSGFFPLWFIYQGKLGENPFGLPSNYKFIRDPNAIIVSPGTMLREKLEICLI